MGKKNRKIKKTEQPDFIPESFRELAFVIIKEYQQSGIFLSESLNDLARIHKFDRIIIRQAQELAFGTVRRSGTLIYLLKKNLTRAWEKVEPDLQLLLQLGVYQILFMNSIPDHAAVNETVELCKELRKNNWARFINGILRNVIRSVSEEETSSPEFHAFKSWSVSEI